MPARITHPVERPASGRIGLSEDDRDAITALAEHGFLAGQIARKLKRHPGTVAWFMFRAGLKGRSPASDANKAPYARKGVLVRPFSDEEDAFLLERAAAGDSRQQIAAAIEPRFGHRRPTNSVRARLMMLASYEAAAEDAQDRAREENAREHRAREHAIGAGQRESLHA